jgi:ribonuclease P protein component
MLRSRKDFARLRAQGRASADRLMVVRFVPNARDHDRYAISTARRLGRAVGRNRLRRRVREILRLTPNHSGYGWDVLIVLRPAAMDASFDELRSTLERLLGAIHGPVKAPA